MALYNIKDPQDKDKFIKRVKALLLNPCTVELTKKQPIRTLKQNAYLHLLFNFFSMETGYDPEYVKINFYKAEANPEIYEIEVEGKLGKVKALRSSADLDTAEMTKSIERFRNWSGAKGIPLPAPTDEAWLEWIRVESDRQYHKNG